MEDRNAELFNDSYERCLSKPGFLDRFYELFLASSEEVAEKFAHTDFQQQKRSLQLSLYLMMSVPTALPESLAHLERIAERHSRRQLDIKPDLYLSWLKCLLQAVREYDHLYDEKIEEAWRRVLTVGIDFMTARY